MAAWAACLLGFVGCASPAFEEYTGRPGPYDELGPVETRVLAEARRLIADGDLELARRRLATLCASLPDNLVAGIALQEVELDLLARGESFPELPVSAAAVEGEPVAAGDPILRLYGRYRGRAEAYGTVAGAILAARLAPDAETRAAWIDTALSADPDCVWAHYAEAHEHASARRFEAAWTSLTTALALDPGHPPARRLEASLYARRGEVELAIDAWRAWLVRYGGDPRVAPKDEAAAHLELANLLAQSGDPAAALATLDSMDARVRAAVDQVSSELVRVVALDGLGRVGEALAVARATSAAAPKDPRPRVQEALLLGDRLGDVEAARAAWLSVLDLLEASGASGAPSAPSGVGEDPAAGELNALLLKLQANAALARLGPAPEADPPEDVGASVPDETAPTP